MSSGRVGLYCMPMPTTFQVEFSPKEAKRPGVLMLSGRISYHEAPELRTALFGALDEGETLLIDLAQVETIDTAALAVLVEGLIATEEKGQEILLCTPSDGVRRMFHLAGLDGALARCWSCLDLASRHVAG